MKSLLLIFLIGTIFAVTYANPSHSSLKVLLQDMEDGDDKVAKTARWLGIASKVIGGLNYALNGGEEPALNQMEDDGDLNQVLLDRIQTMMQEDGDGEDAKAEKAKHYHYRVGKNGKLTQFG